MPEKKRIGEMLIEAGLIDELQLKSALGYQKQWGGKVGSALVEMGFVTEKGVASTLEKQLGVVCTSIEGMDIPPNILHTVKVDIAKKYGVFPLSVEGKTLLIATPDPTDLKALDELSFLLGMRIKPVLALESDIKRAISIYYEGNTQSGRTYKVDVNKLTEKIQMMQPAAGEIREHEIQPEIIHHEMIQPETIRKEEPKAEQKKEIAQKAVIEALIAVLTEKGIITKEELIKKLKEKQS